MLMSEATLIAALVFVCDVEHLTKIRFAVAANPNLVFGYRLRRWHLPDAAVCDVPLVCSVGANGQFLVECLTDEVQPLLVSLSHLSSPVVVICYSLNPTLEKKFVNTYCNLFLDRLRFASMKIKPIYHQMLKASRKRQREVLKLRNAGLTWEAIGKHLGVSRQRAQQIGKSK